jgi:hypothetical protein
MESLFKTDIKVCVSFSPAGLEEANYHVAVKAVTGGV